MQNSLLNQRLQASLLICFFALQTIFGFDIFISVLWPFSRMKGWVSSHWGCILNMTNEHAEEDEVFLNTSEVVPKPLVQARGMGSEQGERLTFHAAERIQLSLVSGARLRIQYCVPASLWRER